jgi:hypothetical protein
MEAGSVVGPAGPAGAAAAGLVAGAQPRVNNRVAIADSIAMRCWGVLVAFVISVRILSPNFAVQSPGGWAILLFVWAVVSCLF